MSRKKESEEPEDPVDEELMRMLRFERGVTEIERNRYERKVIAAKRKKLENPDPPEKKPTMTDQIMSELQEEFRKLVTKRMVDRMKSGMENPTPHTDSVAGWGPIGPLPPEMAEHEKEVFLEMYRTLHPKGKEQMFTSILPYAIDTAKVERIVKGRVTRDGSPATDDSGEPLIIWILVMKSTKPEDAKQAKTDIQMKMGINAETLTFTEGLEGGFVEKLVPKHEANPSAPGHSSGMRAPSQNSEVGGTSISEPSKPGNLKSRGKIISPEKFQSLDPVQRDLQFESVLPAISNLPPILGAIYEFGGQKKKWTIVVENFIPEVKNQAREIILKETGMDVVVLDPGEFLHPEFEEMLAEVRRNQANMERKYKPDY